MSNIIFLKSEQTISCAWATELQHRHHAMFHVLFENGYENIFFTDVESGEWIEEDMGFTALAAMVGKSVKHFLRSPIHVPKLLTWHKGSSVGQLMEFGFLNYYNNDRKMFDIYGANRKYMYTLMELTENEWQIIGAQHMIAGQIDTEMAERIIMILNMYSTNAY